MADPTIYDGIAGVGPGAATELFTPAFFLSTNFAFLAGPAQYGNDDSASRDLDGDGMFDSFEIAMGWLANYQAGSPPNAADDIDGDGLSNLEEQRCLHSDWSEHLASWPGFSANPAYQYPCNPYDSDSDHDGFDDFSELAIGSDPVDPCSHP